MTPREIELSRQLEQCQLALQQTQGELKQALRENELLRQKVDLLARRIFGTSSEKLNRDQLELVLQLSQQSQATVEEVIAARVASTAKSQPKERAPRWPENLPVVEEVLDPEPVKAQPENWRCIGQEVSEQLDYEPARFLRRRTIRRKFVQRHEVDSVPVIAPLPERLLERSLPAPGLLAQVIISKYCDHLPLYRQEQIYKQRHGVNLPRQTLARWVELAAEWLKPVYEHIRTGVMAGGYVQIDETPIDYLDPGNGRTRQGYLWTSSRPGGDVFYRWETSRSAACLENIVAVDFKGTLQCDGYAAYPAFAKGRQNIQLAGCWAHVRRKFHEALEQSPGTSGWLVRQIQNLYAIEAQLRQRRAGPALRAVVRCHQSRPILQRIERALILLKGSGRHLPQSLLGQAIDYALGQWSTLGIYMEDGRIEIDNNLVENAIRPTAIGKKNWLFIGDATAGERSAIIYTLMESCRRRGIDPYAYLREVLTRLPQMTNHQIPEILPSAWQKNHKPLQKAS